MSDNINPPCPVWWVQPPTDTQLGHFSNLVKRFRPWLTDSQVQEARDIYREGTRRDVSIMISILEGWQQHMQKEKTTRLWADADISMRTAQHLLSNAKWTDFNPGDRILWTDGSIRDRHGNVIEQRRSYFS